MLFALARSEQDVFSSASFNYSNRHLPCPLCSRHETDRVAKNLPECYYKISAPSRAAGREYNVSSDHRWAGSRYSETTCRQKLPD